MSESTFYTQNTLPQGISPAQSAEGVPHKIGPYSIEGLLSHGGMSVVYLAREEKNASPIVVKVLAPGYVPHSDMKKQFLNEAHIIRMADHQNIIRVIGEGEWEGGVYIAMEYVQGVSLKQFILQQSLSLKGAIDILLQVSYALLHLHTHGIIHRDLKPENILITETGEIKVIDFGVASLMHDAATGSLQTKGGIGTPTYMSPEQKKHPEKISPASDIYSLGVIAYELIVQKLSFGTFQMQLLPKNIRPIVQKALEPHLEKRYGDIVDFIADINGYRRSDALMKDRTSRDVVAEVFEQVGESHRLLLSESLPSSPMLEVGLARSKTISSLGLFYDSFRPSPDTFLFFLGEFHESQVASLSHIGYLFGVLRTLFSSEPKSPFDLSSFLQKCNERFAEDHFLPPFAVSFVLLDHANDTASIVSCGISDSWHITFGSERPRALQNIQPKIGMHHAAEFVITTDTWRDGDTLFLHTFNTEFDDEAPIESSYIFSALQQATSLSAKRHAEVVYKKLCAKTRFEPENCPKAAITLQRIS